MTNKSTYRKLSSSFFNYAILYSAFLFVVLVSMFIVYEIVEFKEEAKHIRHKSLQASKEKVRNEVEKVISFIDYSRYSMENKMREQIKQKVNEAWTLMDNIYYNYSSTRSKEEIKEMIKAALRNIRFNHGRGYYFIVSTNGVEELYPVKPQLEGKNLYSLRDAKGNYVIKDEIEIVKSKKEGFITDYWSKPGTDGEMIYPKTSYVKIFEPLDWYIGTGEYLNDVKADVQKEVINRIKKTTFGKEGYVFVNTYDGVALVIDSDKYKPGDTIWSVIDAKGVKVIQKEREAVKNPEGDFIYYHWKKKTTNQIAPKVSFIKGVEEWQWMVGSGVYIDEVEKEIVVIKSNLYRKLLVELLYLSVLLIIAILVVYFLAKYFSRKVDNNFKTFTNRLIQSVNSGQPIDKNDFTVFELRQILEPINRVIANKQDAEKQLKNSEIRFRTIFENAPVMFLVLDNHLNYQLSNQVIKRLFSLDKGQKLSKTAILRRFTNKPVNKTFFRLLDKGDGVFREVEVISNEGIRKQNWAIFQSKNNEYILVGYDITDLRIQQEQLKSSNQTKDRVLSIISHDMHAPFNSIVGFSRLLLKSYMHLTDTKRNRYIKHIHSSAQGMHDMLQNILNWARTQSGNISLKKLNVNLKDTLAEIFKTLRPIAGSKQILLTKNVDAVKSVYADPALVRVVLQNFIANSIKFTPENGSVSVESKKTKDGLVGIIITDTGVGMSPDQVNNLMSGTEVQSRKGTANESGTGLGLVICREFIELMGGYYTIESELGKGTTIIVYLPEPIVLS